jgi:hypothetical protein
MALNFKGMLAKVTSVIKPEPAQSIAPWEGPPDQVVAKLCTAHIWNPQTGLCVRCSAPRYGTDSGLKEVLEADKLAKAPQPTGPSNLRIKAPVPVQQAPVAPPAPKPLVLSASSQALIKSKPQPYVPPVRAPGDPYTILDALLELSKGRQGTLMLVKNKTGDGFKVESLYEADEKQATMLLSGSNGLQFRTRVSAREVPLYTPVWR